jgi:hypothetical protein
MKTTHEQKDWLPQNHEALYDQSQQTWNYLKQVPNRERMGFYSSTPQGLWLDREYVPRFDAFSSAFVNWRVPADRTPVLTKLLEEAEKPFQEVSRQLYTGFLKSSPLVTDDDLVEMGLPARHTGGGSASPVAKTYPVVELDSGTIRQLILNFRDQGSASKAKPPGQHGAEVKWGICAAPPASVDDLPNSVFDTHTPLTLVFDETQRGSRVYFCLRWENNVGAKGPWGEIMNAIIP